MASKAPTPSAAHSTSSLSPAPSISATSPLLASLIPLPMEPHIIYSIYTPASNLPTTSAHTVIEQARRHILCQNDSLSLLQSILPSVHIDGSLPILYLFRINSHDRLEECLADIAKLKFDYLSLSETSSYTPQQLYPCSPACASQRNPCTVCLSPPPTNHRPNASASCLLPREPLRPVHSHFLEAVRDRLIEDVCEAAKKEPTHRIVRRFRQGVVLGRPSMKHTGLHEWAKGWESHTFRPLTYCHLEVFLSPSRLTIHPLLRPTPYLPLLPPSTPPILAGTQIVLLPFAVPAYFLAEYHGLTSTLSQRFREALVGWGAGDWEALDLRDKFETLDGAPSRQRHKTHRSRDRNARYILAWMNVQNKHGEDKGMHVVWPRKLCLSYTADESGKDARRQTLAHVPELPRPLQPGTPPPEMSSSPFTREPDWTGWRSHAKPRSEMAERAAFASRTPRSSRLGIGGKVMTGGGAGGWDEGLEDVALEVGGYVDAVAKEREKERERIRKERETAASPTKLALGGTAGALGPPTSPTPSSDVRCQAGLSGSESVVGGMDATQSVDAPLTSISATADAAAIETTSGVNQTHFYPSPPISTSTRHPSSVSVPPKALISPPNADALIETEDLAVTAAVAPPPPPETPSAPSAQDATQDVTGSAGFDADPFSNLDSSWAQPNVNDDFMDLGMGMGMGMEVGMGMGMGMNLGMGLGFNMSFGTNLGTSRTGSGTTGVYGRTNGIDLDDAFTEDDFDFFDGPSTIKPAASNDTVSAPTAATATAASASPFSRRNAGGGFAAASGMSPPAFGDGITMSSAMLSSGTHSSPSWGMVGFGEGFTPRYSDHTHDGVSAGADMLLPFSSPAAQTPSLRSVPATPNVRLAHEDGHHDAGPRRSTVFDAIPFANSHRIADGKYTMGKFALPSPPDEEDRTERVPFADRGKTLNGLRSQYNVATDPRIGMVRKLVGAKRKFLDQSSREAELYPRWLREPEDWWTGKDGDAISEEHDSDEDRDDEDDEKDDDARCPDASESSTPLPSYLPLGPQLLQTHFHHSQLLPLCSPSRPPGAAVAPTSLSASVMAPVNNAPTPVSPAAMIGAVSEKSKSLEAAAGIVAREVVENAQWGEAWLANTTAYKTPDWGVWQADLRTMLRLLSALDYVDGGEEGVDLAILFELDGLAGSTQSALQKLEPPMISVGKGDAIIQVLPTALRFWDKLGLGPRAGHKDVIVFVLFETEGEERIQQVDSWLGCVSAVYNAKRLGVHAPGDSTHCPKKGLLPLRFDSFRKALGTLVSSLSASESTLLFYVVTPLSIMSLASPVFRQVCSAIRRTTQGISGSQYQFHFVPEKLVFGCHNKLTAAYSEVDRLCFAVYDRILRPVDRQMSRRVFEHGEPTRGWFQETAYALAPAPSTKVKFHREIPVPTLDVVDRCAMLHVGYGVSSCGKWVLAAAVDERGEAHDVGVWLSDSSLGAEKRGVVDLVWNFAVRFGRGASVDWRLVIARLGGLGERELDAWISHLNEAVPTCRELPLASVVLLSVEQDASWSFVAPRQNGSVGDSGACVVPAMPLSKDKDASTVVFMDSSMATYKMSSGVRLPFMLSSACFREVSSAQVSYIPEPEPACAAMTTMTVMTTTNTMTTMTASATGSKVSGRAIYSECGILPFETVILVHMPSGGGSSYDGIGMLQLHGLHWVGARGNVTPATDGEGEEDGQGMVMDEGIVRGHMEREIARNYHELCLLSGMRTGVGCFPWHLGAIEVVGSVLERGEDLH